MDAQISRGGVKSYIWDGISGNNKEGSPRRIQVVELVSTFSTFNNLLLVLIL